MIIRGRPGVNSTGATGAAMAGNVVLTEASPLVLRYNANGSNRTVKDPFIQKKNALRIIANTGSANTIAYTDEDDTTIVTLAPGESYIVAGDGSAAVGVALNETTIPALNLGDSQPITMGDSADFVVQHNGTDNLIDSANATAKLRNRLGTTTNATQWQVESDGGATQFMIQKGDGAFSTAWSTADLDASGALQINSSAGALSIGNDAIAQALNLGTGGARVISIGSAAAASMALDAGIGGFALLADTTVEIDAGTALTIESAGGAISIGADAVAQAVNIATGAAARVITIGNAASASLTLEAGVGGLVVNADTTGTMTFGGLLTVNAGAGFVFDSTGAEDPITFRFGDDLSTSVFTVENNSLNDLLTITADGQHARYIKDDSTTAYIMAQAGNNYLKVDTSNSGALMELGNATTNPNVSVLGSGTFTATGGLVSNTIAERTGGSGVTIDGLLIKDGAVVSDRLVNIAITVTNATGGSTDASVDVDVQKLDGANVSSAKAVRLRFYDASRDVLGGHGSTITFTATTGTKIAEDASDDWAEFLTDATGNLTVTVANSADETLYVIGEAVGAAASAGQGCTCVESLEKTIQWAA